MRKSKIKIVDLGVAGSSPVGRPIFSPCEKMPSEASAKEGPTAAVALPALRRERAISIPIAPPAAQVSL